MEPGGAGIVTLSHEKSLTRTGQVFGAPCSSRAWSATDLCSGGLSSLVKHESSSTGGPSALASTDTSFLTDGASAGVPRDALNATCSPSPAASPTSSSCAQPPTPPTLPARATAHMKQEGDSGNTALGPLWQQQHATGPSAAAAPWAARAAAVAAATVHFSGRLQTPKEPGSFHHTPLPSACPLLPPMRVASSAETPAGVAAKPSDGRAAAAAAAAAAASASAAIVMARASSPPPDFSNGSHRTNSSLNTSMAGMGNSVACGSGNPQLQLTPLMAVDGRESAPPRNLQQDHHQLQYHQQHHRQQQQHHRQQQQQQHDQQHYESQQQERPSDPRSRPAAVQQQQQQQQLSQPLLKLGRMEINRGNGGDRGGINVVVPLGSMGTLIPAASLSAAAATAGNLSPFTFVPPLPGGGTAAPSPTLAATASSGHQAGSPWLPSGGCAAGPSAGATTAVGRRAPATHSVDTAAATTAFTFPTRRAPFAVTASAAAGGVTTADATMMPSNFSYRTADLMAIGQGLADRLTKVRRSKARLAELEAIILAEMAAVRAEVAGLVVSPRQQQNEQEQLQGAPPLPVQPPPQRQLSLGPQQQRGTPPLPSPSLLPPPSSPLSSPPLLLPPPLQQQLQLQVRQAQGDQASVHEMELVTELEWRTSSFMQQRRPSVAGAHLQLQQQFLASSAGEPATEAQAASASVFTSLTSPSSALRRRSSFAVAAPVAATASSMPIAAAVAAAPVSGGASVGGAGGGGGGGGDGDDEGGGCVGLGLLAAAAVACEEPSVGDVLRWLVAVSRGGEAAGPAAAAAAAALAAAAVRDGALPAADGAGAGTVRPGAGGCWAAGAGGARAREMGGVGEEEARPPAAKRTRTDQ